MAKVKVKILAFNNGWAIGMSLSFTFGVGALICGLASEDKELIHFGIFGTIIFVLCCIMNVVTAVKENNKQAEDELLYNLMQHQKEELEKKNNLR